MNSCLILTLKTENLAEKIKVKCEDLTKIKDFTDLKLLLQWGSEIRQLKNPEILEI